MWYPDLAWYMFDNDCFSKPPLAVGWLAHPLYSRGAVSDDQIAKLMDVYADSPFREDLHYRGLHPCPFCGACGETETRFGKVHIGSRTILLPSAGALYLSPSTIIHYILVHDYLPPKKYLNALDTVDLDSPVFVDRIAATYRFPNEPNGYARRLGDLLTRRNGLLGQTQLVSKLQDYIAEKIPDAATCWPPRHGVTAALIAEIRTTYAMWSSAEKRAVADLFANYAGSIWETPLSVYTSTYDDVANGLLDRLDDLMTDDASAVDD